MVKIIVNKCYGCLGFSKELYEKLGIKWSNYGYLRNKDFGIDSNNSNEFRANPKLIKAIEELGKSKSSGKLAKLKIVKIPDDVEWEINEYDGMESIHEVHRSW